MSGPTGNASVADMLKLASIKTKWGNTTDPALRNALSAEGDTLRNAMGWGQGVGYGDGLNTGTFTAQQLIDMAAEKSAAATPVPVVNPTVSANMPTMLSGAELANNYGITQDYETIKGIYDATIDDSYAQRYRDQGLAEGKYYDALGGVQSTLMNTFKKNDTASIASGTSRGMQAANQITAALGLAQQSVDGATELSNLRTGLDGSKMADKSMAAQQALTESNMQGGTLGKLASEILGYNMSGYSA